MHDLEWISSTCGAIHVGEFMISCVCVRACVCVCVCVRVCVRACVVFRYRNNDDAIFTYTFLFCVRHFHAALL